MASEQSSRMSHRTRENLILCGLGTNVYIRQLELWFVNCKGSFKYHLQQSVLF